MADLDFAYDLTLDEARRRTAVLEAIGDDWDPIAVLAEEEKAYDMLYSDLDEEQQRIYDELVSAGVLPDRTVIVLPIDPTADRARRAWLACPRCDHGAPAPTARARRTAPTHWQYLLSNQGTVVHLQCPDCGYLWSTDTREGARRRFDAA